MRRTTGFTLRGCNAWAWALLSGFALAGAARAQVLGPGAQGATLRQPWEVSGGSTTRPAAPLQGLWNGPAPAANAVPNRSAQSEVNKDIEVTADRGAWLISVIAYTGEQAPMQARQMVAELREKYKLPAFVFSKGAEERREAYGQARAQIEKQKEMLEKTRERFGDLVEVQKIRVKMPRNLSEHWAVLVGGYPDEAAARRALESVRKLDATALNRSLLETQFYGKDDPKSGKIENG